MLDVLFWDAPDFQGYTPLGRLHIFITGSLDYFITLEKIKSPI